VRFRSYGFNSIELNSNEINKYTKTTYGYIDKTNNIDTIDMELDIINVNTDDIDNDIERLKEQRDYYYHVSKYWYEQAYQLYYYYEQYIYHLYNNEYNLVQI